MQLNTGGHPTAKPGRAWLVIQTSVISSDVKVTGLSLQLNKALTLRAAGAPLTVPSDTIVDGNVPSTGDSYAAWVFDVPRNLKSIQITYHFVGEVGNAASGTVAWQMVRGGSSTATIMLR